MKLKNVGIPGILTVSDIRDTDVKLVHGVLAEFSDSPDLLRSLNTGDLKRLIGSGVIVVDQTGIVDTGKVNMGDIENLYRTKANASSPVSTDNVSVTIDNLKATSSKKEVVELLNDLKEKYNTQIAIIINRLNEMNDTKIK